ncbi:ABC transporter permease [Actinobacteria bacterium YIM 96077]|uniref:ABC transporter permease n=1 Tax=Phytoactinopolyspora halophila TaxID=1981511 RepID=A0A329QYP8_9ACTN|nr:ABC transporter permease [Phytoactinopolyspora halophila]AYY12765.1 ABC transporter permease [Actinobacteria bacterium YIM 96077]RAW16442.1 ABC transporter permease [Phytoactinopolyspora halophila]
MGKLSTTQASVSPPGGGIGAGDGNGNDLDGDTPPRPERSAARRELWRYLAGRISGAAVSMILVLFSAFFIFRIIGGDPVRAIGGDSPMTPEQRAEIEERLGLNEPMAVQFWEYVKDLFTLDWGESYVSSAQVTDLMWDRLPNTLLLTGTALILAAGLGIWIGARAGWKQGSFFEKSQVGISLTLWSAPTFWLGMIVIIVFSVELGMFPVNGMRSTRGVADGFWPEALDVAHHLVLPAVTMAAVIYAQYVLIMRSSILEERNNDYLTVARAKGLRDAVVRRRHAVPNAMLPTVTLIALQFGAIFNGALLTETIFSWPGLGLLFYQAIKIPDIPLLQLLFIFFAGTTILANLLVDILYRFLDPRVRRSA